MKKMISKLIHDGNNCEFQSYKKYLITVKFRFYINA